MVATKQYKIGIPMMIINIYCIGIATSPIILPKAVKGIIIATILKIIEVAYTALEALLCTNGVLAVLII